MRIIFALSFGCLIGCAAKSESDKPAQGSTPIKSSSESGAATAEKGNADKTPGEKSLAEKATTPEKPSTEPTPKTVGEVKLENITVDQLNDVIKANKGKVIVIDVWATFCPPCVAEFPHFVALGQKYAKQDVVCISLTVDDAKAKPQALKFLKKQNSTVANYIINYTSLQTAWDFSGVPVVRVYSKSGDLAKQFTNADIDKDPFTYSQVEEIVKDRLK